MPIEGMSGTNKCVNYIEIAVQREYEGYSNNWYDAIDSDEKTHSYTFTLPSTIDSDLYVTVETYSSDIVPNECFTTSGAPTVNFEISQ